MKSKSPILDGAIERMSNQEYARAMDQSARQPVMDDPSVTAFDLAHGDKLTASKAVEAVQPVKPTLCDTETIYCQTADCESEAGCTVNRDDGSEIHLCAVCASAFEMGRRGMPALNAERDELAARLQELAAAAREVCDPIFTASDGGAMWCAMRQRPRAVEDVERLKSAIALAESEAV